MRDYIAAMSFALGTHSAAGAIASKEALEILDRREANDDDKDPVQALHLGLLAGLKDVELAVHASAITSTVAALAALALEGFVTPDLPDIPIPGFHKGQH